MKKLNKNEYIKYGIYLVLIIVAVIVINIVAPKFFTWRNITTILKTGSLIAIPTVGVTMCLITRGIELSTSGMMAFCPMTVIILYKAGVPFVLCILLGLLASMAVASVSGIVISRVGVPPFITTYVMGIILLGLAMTLGQGSSISGYPDAFVDFTNGRFLTIPNTFWVMIVFGIVFGLFLSKSRTGNWILAMGNNPLVLSQDGINTANILLLIYIISGFCNACSGLLLAGQLSAIHPDQASTYQLDAIASCIIGGTSTMGGEGNIAKSMAGAIFLAAVRNICSHFGFQPATKNVVIGCVIVVLVAYGVIRNNIRQAKKSRF